MRQYINLFKININLIIDSTFEIDLFFPLQCQLIKKEAIYESSALQRWKLVELQNNIRVVAYTTVN